MIMMLAPIQFENSRPALEMVPGDESGRLKLGQDPVHGRQTNIFVGVQESPVDVFGRQMMARFDRQNVEDLDARRRDLEACFAKILAFHSTLS
jgi:hypothetical protein